MGTLLIDNNKLFVEKKLLDKKNILKNLKNMKIAILTLLLLAVSVYSKHKARCNRMHDCGRSGPDYKCVNGYCEFDAALAKKNAAHPVFTGCTIGSCPHAQICFKKKCVSAPCNRMHTCERYGGNFECVSGKCQFSAALAKKNAAAPKYTGCSIGHCPNGQYCFKKKCEKVHCNRMHSCGRYGGNFKCVSGRCEKSLDVVEMDQEVVPDYSQDQEDNNFSASSLIFAVVFGAALGCLIVKLIIRLKDHRNYAKLSEARYQMSSEDLVRAN